MSNYNKVFSEAYKALNPEQKKAVDSIEGPVMVFAGPGTGKTQILALRVANILAKTDAGPSNILCLTFTDAGVRAMRDRLLQIIGPEAFKIEIHTFHSFCNNLIQSNLSLFELHELERLSDVEEVELFRELIDEAGHPLKGKGYEPYFEIVNLRKFYQWLQKENIDINELTLSVQNYLAEIPSMPEFQYKRKHKEFNKGDVNPKKVAEEEKRLQKTLLALAHFSKYKEMLAQRLRYTFDDMILWVINAFKNHSDLLLKYQEQFQYLLVDEYQDTNGSQQEVVSLLASYWEEKANLFVVGDDDQSIFRFQGASIENMDRLIKKYGSNASFISLNRNYRSSQIILDRATALIENNHSRLIDILPELDKKLIASNPERAHLNDDLKLLEYEDVEAESCGIAQMIFQLVDEGKSFSDIAVLYRNHRHAEYLIKYMREERPSLKIGLRRSRNILNDPILERLLLFLKWIDAERKEPRSGDPFLAELILGGFGGISFLSVSRIAHAIRQQDYKSRTGWFECIQDSDFLKNDSLSLNENDIEGLKRLGEMLSSMLKSASVSTLGNLLAQIISSSGLLTEAMEGDAELNAVNVLRTFYEYVIEQNTGARIRNIRQLLEHLKLLERYNIEIPFVEFIGDQDGIFFSTVHGAKGLEFKEVFLIHCDERSWKAKASKSSPYKLAPDEELKHLAGDLETALEDDERRLFYVAITRAEEHMYVSYHRRSKKKEVKPSPFITELLQAGLSVSQEEVNSALMLDYHRKIIARAAQPDFNLQLKDAVSNFRKNFVLSASQLNNYLKCKLSFYFDNVLRVPDEGHSAMHYGTAMHYALEQANAHNEGELTLDQLSTWFEWKLKFFINSYADKKDFDNDLEKGKRHLKAYFEQKKAHLSEKNVEVEKKLKAELNGMLLTGRIDKMVKRDGQLLLIDFKTGNPAKIKRDKRLNAPLLAEELAKKDDPLYNEKLGGDYWRQAVFYKLLAKNDAGNHRIDSFIFELLQPDENDKLIEHKVVISPHHEALVLDQMSIAWNGIQKGDYSPGCGEEKCKWCNYVKENELEIL